jgi:hypothetical protein
LNTPINFFKLFLTNMLVTSLCIATNQHAEFLIRKFEQSFELCFSFYIYIEAFNSETNSHLKKQQSMNVILMLGFYQNINNQWIKLLADSKCLYVFFDCNEPSKKIIHWLLMFW